MSRILTLIALALATAAVATSVAGADTGTKTPSTPDPLAVSWLIGQGLTPSEVEAWTTGECSRQTKSASCYAMIEDAMTASVASSATSETTTIGFRWGDAVIGALAALGLVLLAGAVAAGLRVHHHRGRHAAHA